MNRSTLGPVAASVLAVSLSLLFLALGAAMHALLGRTGALVMTSATTLILLGAAAFLTSRSAIALQSSEQRFHDLFHAPLVGRVIWRDDGGGFEVNDRFLELAGFTREDVRAGRTDANRMRPAGFDGADILAGVQTAGSCTPFETQLLHRDGHRVDVLVASSRLGDTGNVAFVLDITAQKEAERALQSAIDVLEGRNRELIGTREASDARLSALQEDLDRRDVTLEQRRQDVESLANRLANANRELEAFSYSVSHDLRTPLRAIEGFSRQLAERHAASLDARGLDYLARIRAAANRMSQLIDDLLNLSRISRSRLARERIDISAEAAAILAELRGPEPTRSVSCEIEPGLTGAADRRLVRILLENLLGNAWKFTSKTSGALIRVSARAIGGATIYSVGDNGAGFDMAYADKLFGVFQRLHTSDEFEGTGVGLATVRRIVDMHGGRVWAESAPGRGAAFHFTLEPEPSGDPTA